MEFELCVANFCRSFDFVEIPHGYVKNSVLPKLARIYRIELFLDYVTIEKRRFVIECCRAKTIEKIAHCDFVRENLDVIFAMMDVHVVKRIWKIHNFDAEWVYHDAFESLPITDEKIKLLIKYLPGNCIVDATISMMRKNNRKCLKIPKLVSKIRKIPLCAHFGSGELEKTELGRELIATINLYCSTTHLIPVKKDPFGFSKTLEIGMKIYPFASK